MSASNAQLVRQYLGWMRDVRRCAGSTVYVYAGVLSNLVDHLGATPLAEVRTSTLENWLDRPRPRRAKGGRAKPATLQRDVAILRSLYRYLCGRGLVPSDPSLLLVPPVVHNTKPKPVADDHWQRLWQTPLPDDAVVALGLGFFCGLRRAEVVRLTPGQVDTSGGVVAPFVRKGGHEHALDYAALLDLHTRFLPHLVGDPERFTSALRRLTEGRQSGPGVYLLPWGEEVPASAQARRLHTLPEGATDPMAFNRKLSRWARAAGLPPGAVTPHRLRHSFVTNALRAGLPLQVVSRLAAHRSLETTMRYTQAGNDELRQFLEAAKQVEPTTYNRWG